MLSKDWMPTVASKRSTVGARLAREEVGKPDKRDQDLREPASLQQALDQGHIFS
jgi:hypothetical protein